eukprot:358257-Prorocentrum_minimum.AAC.1
MGASTAILYSQRDPSIAGLVLDSAFSRFNDLAVELVESYSSENGNSPPPPLMYCTAHPEDASGILHF